MQAGERRYIVAFGILRQKSAQFFEPGLRTSICGDVLDGWLCVLRKFGRMGEDYKVL